MAALVLVVVLVGVTPISPAYAQSESGTFTLPPYGTLSAFIVNLKQGDVLSFSFSVISPVGQSILFSMLERDNANSPLDTWRVVYGGEPNVIIVPSLSGQITAQWTGQYLLNFVNLNKNYAFTVQSNYSVTPAYIAPLANTQQGWVMIQVIATLLAVLCGVALLVGYGLRRSKTAKVRSSSTGALMFCNYCRI